MKPQKENLLVTIGRERFTNNEREFVDFVANQEVNALLNDLEDHPHAFVLACLMNRQMRADKVWSIPLAVKKVLGSYSIEILGKQSLAFYQKLFTSQSLHRFSSEMSIGTR